jgi:ABC-2 type transport system ATP-binding protein
MMEALRITHLSKRFGQVQAVQDLTLSIETGEIFGFLGPNGAGKTTTIAMICGLLKPNAGEIFLHGKALAQRNNGIRALVGVCPQTITLWEKLTCLENLAFMGEMYGLPRAEAKKRGERLLEELGLAEKRSSRAGALSGGMQRRLNLALALVHNPDLLVLDEPEAGLDPQSRVMVRNFIRAWAQLGEARTVVFTTHNMDEAERLVNRLAVIDHGRLLVVDSPDNLKRRYGQGDILEIRLNGNAAKHQAALHAMTEMGANACLREDWLEVRAFNAVDRLPEVLQTLRTIACEPVEVRLRGNTLEDVFIALTGRRLRE